MKKLFSFAAVLAVLVACNNGKNEPAPVKDNPQAEYAGTVTFEGTKPVVNNGGDAVSINSLTHFPNGDYAATGFVTGPAQTKSALVKRLVGRFTVSSGVYKYSGDLNGATLTIEGGKVAFKIGNITGSGDFVPSTPNSNPITNALCAAHWKLSYIEAKVKDKNVSVIITDKDGINPNDVEKVAEYINKKGADIPMDKVRGYYIKSIGLSVDPSTIIVEFENGKPTIEGEWSPNVLAKSFTYSLNAELDGQLFDGEASGTFDFADNYNTLIIKMTAKNSSGLADIIIKAKKIQ